MTTPSLNAIFRADWNFTWFLAHWTKLNKETFPDTQNSNLKYLWFENFSVSLRFSVLVHECQTLFIYLFFFFLAFCFLIFWFWYLITFYSLLISSVLFFRISSFHFFDKNNLIKMKYFLLVKNITTYECQLWWYYFGTLYFNKFFFRHKWNKAWLLVIKLYIQVAA